MAFSHDEEIEQLLTLAEPEAARELITLYRESHWRSTRLRVVRALCRAPAPRALEFLMRIAADENDLTFCEEAVWALGRCRRGVAARFLVHLYDHCSEVVKPHVIGALGESLDATLVPRFLEQLAADSDPAQSFSARNIVLALSELKESRVVPWLERFVVEGCDPQVVQSGMLGLGRVGRSTAVLDSRESFLQKDAFLWQFSKNVRLQIQFRSQWKLEDYLQKIFEGENPHAAIPFELNGFRAEDLIEGLRLFTDARYHERMAFALGKVNAPEVAAWYEEFLPPASLEESSLFAALVSVAQHHDVAFKSYLGAVGVRVRESHDNVALFAAWVQAVVLCLPRAEEVLQELCSGETFARFSVSEQIALLNELANHALIVQKDAKRKKAAVKLIDGLLSRSLDDAVRARVLRALGQIGEVGNKAHETMRESVSNEAMAPSILFLCEKVPARQCAEILVEAMRGASLDAKRKVAILKAWAGQEEVPPNAIAKFEEFVAALLESSDTALASQALLCAAAHPRPVFLNAVRNALGCESLRLPALVAARSFRNEEIVESVGACLASPSEVVVGRALDVLTLLPGARSKRLALDHFLKHPLDEAVSDKMIRSLEAPSQAGGFFAEKVAEVLAAHPDHPLREGLVDLRERLLSGVRPAVSAEPSSQDVRELDGKIASRVSNYQRFEEDVKSALRAAEMPFHHPEMFRGGIDKSTSAVAFCKAIDLMLERQLGRQRLFPKFEKNLHEFQNIIHMAGLNDHAPAPRRVREVLRLEGHFSDHTLPLHKMSLVAQGVLSGRIVFEQWKILDGLRAWAVVILLFGRGAFLNGRKPLVEFPSVMDADIVQFSKRLMNLQDLRNPAAHRETWLQFPRIDEVRSEVSMVFREWQRMVS